VPALARGTPAASPPPMACLNPWPVPFRASPCGRPVPAPSSKPPLA